MAKSNGSRRPLFRSLVRSILASARAARYAAVEPLLLNRARRRHGNENALSGDVIVSVVIPTYSRFEMLHTRTVPSISKQSHRNVEIVVVGDGCPQAVAQRHALSFSQGGVQFHNLRWKTRYPREALCRWMVLGTRPMNAGMRKTSGAWILFMSDDDCLMPGAIEDMLEEARQSGAEVVFTRDMFADDITEPVGRPKKSDGEILIEHCFSKIFMMRSYLKFFRWNTASHRKQWNRPADYDLFLRMQHAGVRFAMTSRPGNVVHAVPHSEGRQGSAAEVWLADHDLDARSESVIAPLGSLDAC